MKKLLLLLVGIILTSCTAESIAQQEPVKQLPSEHVNKECKFTVIWTSNQENPYAKFCKHVFKDCKIQSTTTEIYRENSFEITLLENQMFDIYIEKGASVKNPEIYVAIYKGDVLQYEQEVNTNGFVITNFVSRNGNIGGYGE